MPIEQIICKNCGSTDVVELKPNTYACRACESVFKFVDPSRSEVEVAPSLSFRLRTYDMRNTA